MKRALLAALALLAVAPAAAQTFDRDQRDAFAMFDRDGDGQLSRDEVFAVTVRFDPQAKRPDVDKQFATADANQDNFLSYNEFVDMLGNQPATESLAMAFARFDRNANGLIDAAELRRGFATMGDTLTDEEAKAMIREGDRNNDGVLSRDEFLAVLR
jgi:calmodulin